VVLPHPKQQERDVVVFLDEALAAPSQEEAEQRGAVAALHRVQGDRALDRLLPRQYGQQWRDLEQQASEGGAGGGGGWGVLGGWGGGVGVGQQVAVATWIFLAGPLVRARSASSQACRAQAECNCSSALCLADLSLRLRLHGSLPNIPLMGDPARLPQHEERQRRAAEAAARQRAQQERQRAAAKRQQPAAVIMADDSRRRAGLAAAAGPPASLGVQNTGHGVAVKDGVPRRWPAPGRKLSAGTAGRSTGAAGAYSAQKAPLILFSSDWLAARLQAGGRNHFGAAGRRRLRQRRRGG
jgi:hypothetical protein